MFHTTLCLLPLMSALVLAPPVVAWAHGDFAMEDVVRECGASTHQINYIRDRAPAQPSDQWVRVCRNLRALDVDVVNVLLGAPDLLDQRNSFIPVLNDLTSLGFVDPRAMINKNPRLLRYPMPTLRSKIRNLLDSGVLGAAALIERDSTVLEHVTAKNLARVLTTLDRIGFTRSRDLLAARPRLLTMDLRGALQDQIRMLRTEGLLRAEEAIQSTPELLDISKDGFLFLITKLKRAKFANPLNLVRRYPEALGFLIDRSLDARLRTLNDLGFTLATVEEEPALLALASRPLNADQMRDALRSKTPDPDQSDVSAEPVDEAPPVQEDADLRAACGLSAIELATLTERLGAPPKSGDLIETCRRLVDVGLNPQIVLASAPGVIGHPRSFAEQLDELRHLGFTDPVTEVHARPSLLVVDLPAVAALSQFKKNRAADLRAILGRAPFDLTLLDRVHIKRTIDLLRAHAVPFPRRALVAYPGLVGVDVDVRLPQLLRFLADRGFAEPMNTFVATPSLVGVTPTTLGQLLDRLTSLGFRNAVTVIERLPDVWGYVADRSLATRLATLREAGIANPGDLIDLHPDVLRDPTQPSVAAYALLSRQRGLDHATIARQFTFPVSARFLDAARKNMAKPQPTARVKPAPGSGAARATELATAETAPGPSTPTDYLANVWTLPPHLFAKDTEDSIRAYADRGRASHAQLIGAGVDPNRLPVATRMACVTAYGPTDVAAVIARFTSLRERGVGDPQGLAMTTPPLASDTPPSLGELARTHLSNVWGLTFPPSIPKTHDRFFDSAFERARDVADRFWINGVDPRRLPERFRWAAATRLKSKTIWTPIATAFPTVDARAWALGLLGFDQPLALLVRHPGFGRKSLGDLALRIQTLADVGVTNPQKAMSSEGALLYHEAADFAERADVLRRHGFGNVGRMVDALPTLLAYDSATNVVPTLKSLTNDWGFTLGQIETRPDLIATSLKRANELRSYLQAQGIAAHTLPLSMKMILFKRPMNVADLKRTMVDAGIVGEAEQRSALRQHLYERGLFMRNAPCDELLGQPFAMAAE